MLAKFCISWSHALSHAASGPIRSETLLDINRHFPKLFLDISVFVEAAGWALLREPFEEQPFTNLQAY